MENIDRYVIFLGRPLDYPVDGKEPDNADLPPEFCRYSDEGCELFSSCLECPFPKCIEDMPHGRDKQAKLLRDREIVRLYTTKKQSLEELMARFKVSRRTLYRALSAGEDENE